MGADVRHVSPSSRLPTCNGAISLPDEAHHIYVILGYEDCSRDGNAMENEIHHVQEDFRASGDWRPSARSLRRSDGNR